MLDFAMLSLAHSGLRFDRHQHLRHSSTTTSTRPGATVSRLAIVRRSAWLSSRYTPATASRRSGTSSTTSAAARCRSGRTTTSHSGSQRPTAPVLPATPSRATATGPAVITGTTGPAGNHAYHPPVPANPPRLRRWHSLAPWCGRYLLVSGQIHRPRMTPKRST